MNPQNLNVTLHILRVNLIHARPTMGLNVMRQDNDLKDEEKAIFDFIEFFGELLHDNDEALKYFLSFLLNFICYDANEPHYEMFVRRTFFIISDGIIKDYYSPSILYDLIPELYSKSSEIVDLRYHNNSCMSLVFSMKNNSSLFETAGTFILQITAHILDKNESEDKNSQEESKEESFMKPKLTIKVPDDGEGDHDEVNESETVSDSENTPRKTSLQVEKAMSSTLRAIDEEDSMIMSPSRLKNSNITISTIQELILNSIMDLLNN